MQQTTCNKAHELGHQIFLLLTLCISKDGSLIILIFKLLLNNWLTP